MDTAIRDEILLIALFALSVFLFLCNFGIVGVAGGVISDVMFGIFGMTAYAMPVVLFLMVAFGPVNSGNSIATRKLMAGVVLFLIVGMIFELFTGYPSEAESYSIKVIYENSSKAHAGGGVIAGSLAYLCYHFMGMIGTVLTVLVAAVIAIVVLTERSFVSGVKSGSRRVYERTREDARFRKERAKIRREEIEEERKQRREERRLHEEELENEKILRMDKKISGVMLDTALTHSEPVKDKVRDDMHEINLEDFDKRIEEVTYLPNEEQADCQEKHKIRINSVYASRLEESSDRMSEITGLYDEEEKEENSYFKEEQLTEPVESTSDEESPKAITAPNSHPEAENPSAKAAQAPSAANKMPKKYIFPPLSKLKKERQGAEILPKNCVKRQDGCSRRCRISA